MRAVYEIMWETIVEPDWQHITKWHMRIACWIPKATNTHSGYVIFIASPLQQWLHVCVSSLRYRYIDCLVYLELLLFIWYIGLLNKESALI